MFIWNLINWDRVTERLRELLKNKSLIEKSVDQEIKKALKQRFPDKKVRVAFVLKHQAELKRMRDGLVWRYSYELKEVIGYLSLN